MNPRVTPICHFSLADGTNLAGSLYTQMTGLRPLSRPAPINRDLIALFPNEIVRSPSSEYLQSCQHDVPWNEPELVRSVLNQALRTGIFRRVRTFLERYFPAVVGALVRLGLIGARTGAIRRPISTGDDLPFVMSFRTFWPTGRLFRGSAPVCANQEKTRTRGQAT